MRKINDDSVSASSKYRDVAGPRKDPHENGFFGIPAVGTIFLFSIFIVKSSNIEKKSDI